MLVNYAIIGSDDGSSPAIFFNQNIIIFIEKKQHLKM